MSYQKIGGFNNNPFPKLIQEAKGYLFGAPAKSTPQKVVKSREVYRKVVKPATPTPQKVRVQPKAKPWYQEVFD